MVSEHHNDMSSWSSTVCIYVPHLLLRLCALCFLASMQTSYKLTKYMVMYMKMRNCLFALLQVAFLRQEVFAWTSFVCAPSPAQAGGILLLLSVEVDDSLVLITLNLSSCCLFIKSGPVSFFFPFLLFFFFFFLMFCMLVPVMQFVEEQLKGKKVETSVVGFPNENALCQYSPRVSLQSCGLVPTFVCGEFTFLNPLWILSKQKQALVSW